jgi:hypothetical protein
MLIAGFMAVTRTRQRHHICQYVDYPAGCTVRAVSAVRGRLRAATPASVLAGAVRPVIASVGAALRTFQQSEVADC